MYDSIFKEFPFCKSSVLDAIFGLLFRISLLPLLAEGNPNTIYCTLNTTSAFAELPELSGIEVGTLALHIALTPHILSLITSSCLSRFE